MSEADKMQPKLDLTTNASTSTEMTDTIVEVSSSSSARSTEQVPSNEQATQAQETGWQKLLAGVSLAILSSLCFSISCVVVKCLTDIKPSQEAWFRYIESKEPCFGPSNWWWRLWMLLRGICGATSLFLQYTVLNYISSTETMIIMLATPVCVFIIARIFLGEEFGRYHVLSLVLSIVGILLTSNIGGIDGKGGNSTTVIASEFSNTSMTTSTDSYSGTTESEDSSSANYLLGALLALGAMLFDSLSYIMMRNLRTTHPSVILFNFSLISLVEMSIINYAFYDFNLPNTGYSGYMLAVLGVISYYAQMFQTKATQIEDAGVVSVVRSSGEAFFAFIFQIVFIRDIPGLFTILGAILGAILVLASILLLSFRKFIISQPDDPQLEEQVHANVEAVPVPQIPANAPIGANAEWPIEPMPNPMARNRKFIRAETHV